MTARKIPPFGRNDNAELESLDDEALARLVKERANQPTIPVSMADLSGPEDASAGKSFKAREMRGEYRVGANPVGWVRPEAVTHHNQCPPTWKMSPLNELGTWSGGGTPSKATPAYWESGSIPWVSPKDMKAAWIHDSEDHITLRAISESTANLLPVGSVLLVTRSGILRHTLPVAVTKVSVTVNQDLKALTPKDDILPEYVAWALRAFSRDILNTCSKQGTTVNSLETPRLLRFEIPVAPLDQQKRIVAEIEKQFSRLDEAVANLKRVKAHLRRYKAAVLKGASKAASSKPKPNTPAAKAAATKPANNSCNASSKPAAACGKARANTKCPPRPTCPNCRKGGCGQRWIRSDKRGVRSSMESSNPGLTTPTVCRMCG